MAPLIVKLGGAALENTQALSSLLHVCARLHRQGRSIVVVHGGGSLVDQQLKQAGLTSQKHNGLRITPQEHLPVVVGALAGMANKQLVAAAQQCQLPAVGLSLLDGVTVSATPVPGLGHVGQPAPGNNRLLTTLLAVGMVPVISSIAADSRGRLLNVNADDAAACVCQLLDGELLLLSDVPGVLDDAGELIPELSSELNEQLTGRGVIHGGMQVKVSAAQALANQLGSAVRIASWRDADALLGAQAPGTAVLPAQPETQRI